MASSRDIEAFEQRAEHYESGWLGKLHRDVADRVLDLVLERTPAAQRILDVGCGTGYLLRQMSAQLPDALELNGIDAATRMIENADSQSCDPRLRFLVGFAEAVPYADASFDLVVSTTSFDHWCDQQAGLLECARVLAPGGLLVLADLFSILLTPTLVGTRRHKARTKRRARRLFAAAGLQPPEWHDLGALVIRAAIAAK